MGAQSEMGLNKKEKRKKKNPQMNGEKSRILVNKLHACKTVRRTSKLRGLLAQRRLAGKVIRRSHFRDGNEGLLQSRYKSVEEKETTEIQTGILEGALGMLPSWVQSGVAALVQGKRKPVSAVQDRI